MKTTSANEALHIMHSNPVGIVSSDMRMPEINGKELAERIHAAPFCRCQSHRDHHIEFRDLNPGNFDAAFL